MGNFARSGWREGATLQALFSALHLLLGADVTVMATLSLAAVSALGWEASVTLSNTTKNHSSSSLYTYTRSKGID